MYKSWIDLSTCSNSGGIYLDLVPDCTSQSCINAIKRFMYSRGASEAITLDNGPYFLATDVQNFAANSDICGSLTSKCAMVWGIFKMFKRFLRKVLGNSRLDYEQMPRVLKEVDNDYTDKDITEPLTPNNCTVVTWMFIIPYIIFIVNMRTSIKKRCTFNKQYFLEKMETQILD